MDNREFWLATATDELRPHFRSVGYDVPRNIRFSIGFTSHGNRSRRIGECWAPIASDDGHHEIFIKPDRPDSVSVLDVLVHELVHATVPFGSKHGPVFRRCAVAVGLTGRMTATTANDALKDHLEQLIEKIGPIPHAKLNLTVRADETPKQNTRLLKVACDCGYTVRMARKWIDAKGTPLCPEHGVMVCDSL